MWLKLIFTLLLVGTDAFTVHYEPLCTSFDVIGEDKDLFDQCAKSGIWNAKKEYFAARAPSFCVDEMIPNLRAALESGESVDEVRFNACLLYCVDQDTGAFQQCQTSCNLHFDKVVAVIVLGVPDDNICDLLKPALTNEEATMDSDNDNQSDGELLGADECVSSPEVVCADLYLAKRCNRYDLCMRHMWKSGEVAAVASVVSGGDVECDECVSAMDMLKQALADNATRQEIIEKVEFICERFVSDDTCKQYIEAYLPEIIDMIENDLDSKQVCSLAGLCKDSLTMPAPLLPQNIDPEPIDLGGLLGADECTQQLKYVCQSVQSAKKCDRFDICLSEMWTSKDQITALLDAGAGEDVSYPGVCDACRAVVEMAKTLIEQEKTIEEITDALEKSCEMCPNTTECKAFIEEYAPEIIRMVDAGLNSELICGLLQMCTLSQVEQRRFDFLLMPDVSAEVEHQSRHRRAFRDYDYDYDYDGDDVFSFAKLIVNKISTHLTKGACYTCKMVVHKMALNEAPTNPAMVPSYIADQRKNMCSWLPKRDCPDEMQFTAMIQAGEFLPEVECPVKGLCDDNGNSTLIDHLDEMFCTFYTSLFNNMNDADSWDQLKMKVQEKSSDKPIMQAMLLNALEDARESRDEFDDQLSPKEILEEELLMEDMIGTRKCEIFSRILTLLDYDYYDYYNY